MPHSPSLACTTADPVGPPVVRSNPPPQAGKRRGNPNLALAPRCGARTRAGCPCRAPSIHGKLRCRMHGGHSTGPRTPEGRARVAAARTTHGDYGADKRAFNRHHVTFMRRARVNLSVILCCDRLPPEFAARWALFAPELQPPPRPTHGITRAEDRTMLQAETAALAPWQQAIALARQARRTERAARAALCGALTAAQARPLAPERATGVAAAASAGSPATPAAARAEPLAPIRPPAILTAPRRAAGGGGAQVPAQPLAPELAVRGVRGTSAAEGLAVLARAHAPERAGGPAAAASAAVATASAAVAAALASAWAEPLAPIPPAVRSALAQASAGICATQPAGPHATERPGRGASSGPVPAGLAAQARAQARERVPATHAGNRTLPVGRAARRWLRQQKLMQQNQPEGRWS